MCTSHSVIFGNSNHMVELADSSIDLVVTSPPYPIIKMWDDHFSLTNLKISKLWKKLDFSK